VKVAASPYAVRRVNPFLGVTQVVELEIGRALSTDGVNWEIQLAVERPPPWGSLNRDRSEKQFYRYGVWSNEEGLAHFPVHPALDAMALREAAETLIVAAGEHRSSLPFALADRFELWLLDGTDRTPFALLATLTAQHLIPLRHAAAWSAAPAGVDGFVAPSLSGDGTAGDRARHPRRHLDAVEELVKRRAGPSRPTQWFERRHDDGAAVAAGRTARSIHHRSDVVLPELPLAEHWAHAADEALIGDYLAWLAPRLLILPLPAATRAHLERAAAVNPPLVDRWYRLYPATADANLLNRVRVQARLMEAAAAI